MKRVLILAYYFPPIGGGGVQRAIKISQYLPRFGWSPIVVTRRGVPGGFPRDDSLLPAVRVPIVHVPCWLSPPYATMRRDSLLGFLVRFVYSFFVPDCEAGWIIPAVHLALRVMHDERIDVILSTSPPASAHFVGYLLHRLTDVPWIADFRDAWTTEPNRGIRSPISRIRSATVERYLERLWLRHADLVTAVSSPICEDLASQLHSDTSKIRLVTNGFEPEEFDGVPAHEFTDFSLVYTGSLSSGGRDVRPFLQAVKELAETDSHWREQVSVWFVGSGKSGSLQAAIDELGLGGQVRAIDFVSRAEAIAYQKGASVLLLFGSATTAAGKRHILSGKLFEYLGAQRPILGLVPRESASAKIIERFEAGLIVDSGDVNAIKEGLRLAYEQYGATPAQSVPAGSNHAFHWRNIVSEFSRLMESLISR